MMHEQELRETIKKRWGQVTHCQACQGQRECPGGAVRADRVCAGAMMGRLQATSKGGRPVRRW